MRLKGRQAQFLIGVLASWGAVRAVWLWPTRAIGRPAMAAAPVPISTPQQPAAENPRARDAVSPPRTQRPPAARQALPRDTIASIDSPGAAPAQTVPLPENPDNEAAPMPAPAPLFPPLSPHRSRIEAQAYLFWRPGAGTPSLAARGELGGSQIAARIAVPMGHGLAAAARVYAPLRHEGAEAAIGIDWHPLPTLPVRLSIERRQRLDALGRSAWSAYAAGGFYRGGGLGRPMINGYAQAGIVGTQRRDLFVDGAVRAGYRLPIRAPAITVGAGVWGAAQPQVARLDAGPRLAVVVPVQAHSLTLEVDGRFRTAGNAAPGSGAALTLAADF